MNPSLQLMPLDHVAIAATKAFFAERQFQAVQAKDRLLLHAPGNVALELAFGELET